MTVMWVHSPLCEMDLGQNSMDLTLVPEPLIPLI